MSKYAQASMKKKMRNASRPGPGSPKQGTHWVEPSARQNEAGQRRVRRRQAVADVNASKIEAS